MGAMSRRKGAKGEREIIKLLQPIVDEVYQSVDIEAPRLQRNALQSDGGGFDIVGLDWVALECKRCETLGVSVWWQQCVRQAGRDREPILLYRRSNEQWRVQLYATLYPDSTALRVAVTVDIRTFLHYFRRRLVEKLGARK